MANCGYGYFTPKLWSYGTLLTSVTSFPGAHLVYLDETTKNLCLVMLFLLHLIRMPTAGQPGKLAMRF